MQKDFSFLIGAFCSHEQMEECHPGCGHWFCPCGISWDEHGEGEPFDEELFDIEGCET